MSPTAAPRLVSPGRLAELLADGDTVVLDVRTPGEFGAGAIDGSHLLPLDQLSDHLPALGAGMTQPVTLVCRSGQRAAVAYGLLMIGGAADVQVLEGGLRAWQEAGQPVTAAPGKRAWELERQVRLVAGGLVLSGILASLRLPKARLLSGAVGGGLTVAAISNTCAMGNALMKLPYNRVDAGRGRKAVQALTGR